MGLEWILLTGATGALGTILLGELLAAGHKVICLVRPHSGISPEDRIRQTFKSYPLSQLEVIGGDICQPFCGLRRSQRDELARRVRTVIHCAASINFLDEDAAFTSNVLGLSNVLAVTEGFQGTTLHHVSTAYIAGEADQFSESDRYVGQAWRNPYERSKYCGEELLAAWSRLHPDRQVIIHRPSIIIGKEDGTPVSWDGYYMYFYPIFGIAKTIKRLAAAGKNITAPLVMVASETSTLNLVPVDWVARRIAKSVEANLPSATLHLTHPNPPRVIDVLRWGLEFFDLKEVSIVGSPENRERFIDNQLSSAFRFQQQLDRVHRHFWPYMTTHPIFDTASTRQMLGGLYTPPPELTPSFLSQILSCASRANWGQPEKR